MRVEWLLPTSNSQFFNVQLDLVLFAAAADALVAKASEAGADERGNDEEPHLTHGTPAFSV